MSSAHCSHNLPARTQLSCGSSAKNALRAIVLGFSWLALLPNARAAPVSPQQANAPAKGWTISGPLKLGATNGLLACVAIGPSDGHAILQLAAVGPQFMLMIDAPDFPTATASYQAALSFDGKPPVEAAALGDRGLLSIGIGRGESARITVASSRVSVTVDGHTHDFSLANAAAALDAVARCASEPTLAEQHDVPTQPIPGAPAWRMEASLPGVRTPACTARIAGDEIDTMVTLNNKGDLLIIGGHSNWASWGGDVPLALIVDGGPPVTLRASTVQNLILVRIEDPALVNRLRSAKVLDWKIPTGQFRGEVAGFGTALDAVSACKAKPNGNP